MLCPPNRALPASLRPVLQELNHTTRQAFRPQSGHCEGGTRCSFAWEDNDNRRPRSGRLTSDGSDCCFQRGYSSFHCYFTFRSSSAWSVPDCRFSAAILSAISTSLVIATAARASAAMAVVLDEAISPSSLQHHARFQNRGQVAKPDGWCRALPSAWPRRALPLPSPPRRLLASERFGGRSGSCAIQN